MKWIGAVLVIIGCGGFGMMQAMAHRREEVALRQLIGALDYMECELRYRLTALPQLCRQTAAERSGCIKHFFSNLAKELEDQISPDVKSCMNAALASTEQMPSRARTILLQLGGTLGRFDVDGQIGGLNAARMDCRQALDSLSENRDVRLRSYQTLGLCAGAALAILFI